MAAVNQAGGEVVMMGEQMSMENALNPEAILDCTLECDTALCVKYKVEAPYLSNYQLYRLADRLNIRHAILQTNEVRYGSAIQLSSRSVVFGPQEPVVLDDGRLYNFQQPFAAEVNLLDPLKSALFAEYGLDRWIQMKGVLPSVFPDWEGISYPAGSIFGRGTCVGLGQGLKQFARVHYVARGVERWCVIPRDQNQNINDRMRTYLTANGCPQGALRCPTFLNHSNFMFDEDFLIQNFNAKVFEVVSGEAVLVQAGVYTQVLSKIPGLVISSCCIPRKWLELDFLSGCTDVDQEITQENLLEIKKTAIHAKNYAATIVRLAPYRLGSSNQLPPPNANLPAIVPVINLSDSSDTEDADSGVANAPVINLADSDTTDTEEMEAANTPQGPNN